MIQTFEERISKRAKTEQLNAERAAHSAIVAAVAVAFPKQRLDAGWEVTPFIRALLHSDSGNVSDDENDKLKEIREKSIASREDSYRDDLTSTLQSLAWALEEVAGN